MRRNLAKITPPVKPVLHTKDTAVYVLLDSKDSVVTRVRLMHMIFDQRRSVADQLSLNELTWRDNDERNTLTWDQAS